MARGAPVAEADDVAPVEPRALRDLADVASVAALASAVTTLTYFAATTTVMYAAENGIFTVSSLQPTTPTFVDTARRRHSHVRFADRGRVHANDLRHRLFRQFLRCERRRLLDGRRRARSWMHRTRFVCRAARRRLRAD
jgi:hypothetical protein